MAAIRAVTLKLLLTFFISLSVKKPLFTNTTSCCYAFHGENIVEPENLHFTSSFWEFYRGKGLSLNPKFTLKILLILSGDIEVCPGPRARCIECEKCFRRNTDQRTCSGCSVKFHDKCLNLVSGVFTCNACTPQRQPNHEANPMKRSLKELESLCRLPGLKMIHQNIRGLFGKKDQIHDILATFSVNIFGITELFLTQDIPSSFVEIPGYTFVRKSRKSGIGGGVGAYIKDGTRLLKDALISKMKI